ncbi:MAG: HEAT repeat domain-containing protein [Polyangiaceae bacterium]|nr:HEAT repeat domain-containing protein [Polyangiaceae bacterium]
MLDGLDDIDWGCLTHAYGPASDVPGLIRGLLSADKPQRDSALRELFSSIWHQGTVYEAAIHALPFLIELLGAPDEQTPDRESVALLVASIVGGRGYFEVHHTRELINPFTREPMPPPPDLDERLAAERVIVAEVRRRGERAIPLLVPYLKHEEPDIRRSVAEAISCYPRLSATTVPALHDALATETDDETRTALNAALTAVASGPA